YLRAGARRRPLFFCGSASSASNVEQRLRRRKGKRPCPDPAGGEIFLAREDRQAGMEGLGVATAVGKGVGEDQSVAFAAAEGEAGPDELRLAARIAAVQVDQGGQDS